MAVSHVTFQIWPILVLLNKLTLGTSRYRDNNPPPTNGAIHPLPCLFNQSRISLHSDSIHDIDS
jgi:hypothetical protein